MASQRAPIRLADVIAALSLATDLADHDAVTAVLAAAGHRVAPVGRELVAGLTERELAVLRLLAHGRSTKQLAAEFRIAPKTADNHIQSIYSKAHVSTRSGATLFAVERGLLSDVA